MSRVVLSVSIVMMLAACGGSSSSSDPTDTGLPPSQSDAGADVDAVPPTGDGKFAVIDVYAPTALSYDGTIAALGDRRTGDVYLYDVASGTKVKKDPVGDPSYNLLTSMSGDGKRLLAYIGDQSAGVKTDASLWEAGKGWKSLGTIAGYQGCDNDRSSGFELNQDGSVAVGMLWENCSTTHAFRWTDASGQGVFTPLQHLGVGYDRATVVSADGSVAGGFSQQGPMVDRSPAIWFADNTGLLLDPAKTIRGEVHAITRDGTMVAGTWNTQGFYWTKEKGVQLIGKLPGQGDADSVYVRNISDDKKLIFGSSGDAFNGVAYAFVWTEAGGMQKLQDIAVQHGVTLPVGWHMSHVMSASADGTVTLGVLTSGQLYQSFVLTLPASAYGN
jgi:uncharacterized membrane protein